MSLKGRHVFDLPESTYLTVDLGSEHIAIKKVTVRRVSSYLYRPETELGAKIRDLRTFPSW